MSSIFQLMQDASTPNLAKSDEQVFGEREYGHVGTAAAGTHASKNFDEDIFG
jgi:hypothetical protein